ncbi:MAG: ABC transporter substrate-binding protein [Burkholderiales bacterium]|nr:ABC transporter substrate-binding protein [Phycisphaerae bacterium]
MASLSGNTSFTRRAVRIGFVPLIDAAPVILAHELGFFREEGLDVQLSREIGWGNVRDKLAFGHLNASHALLGLPIQSAIADASAGESIIAVMSLGSGGDAITLSERLLFSGVNSAASLARYVRQSRGQVKPVFAHVFSCSMHHYLLRDWLAAGGLNPDEDVRLCVLPPPQMAGHLGSGHLDGFCVGEPWNTIAHQDRSGRIVSLTTDILPAHPEKVLAVNRKWAAAEPDLLVPMIRSVLRACAFCSDAKNFARIAATLARPKYLNVSPATLQSSLALDRTFGLRPSLNNLRTPDWEMRSFVATFPSVTHMAWLLNQMVRWQHASSAMDPWQIARSCIDATAYRAAAASLGIDCPQGDAPPMPLRGGGLFAEKISEPRLEPV